MPAPEPFLLYTRKFAELGVDYLISGSVAAIFYGEPRMTNDVDLVVFLKREHLSKLQEAFPAEEFYCPPLSVIQVEWAREQRGHFNLIHHQSGFKADIYTSGREDAPSLGAGARPPGREEGETITLAPPEYVIVRKLQFFRAGPVHQSIWRDVGRMLFGLGENWDREALNAVIREHGLQEEWQAALAFDD